jgi:hypothetical protein
VASFATATATWFPGRLGLSGKEIGQQTRNLVLAKHVLFAVGALTGLASVVQGRALTGQAPDGAVPIESGTTRRHDAREDRGALALGEPAREPENLNIGVTGASLAITTVLFMKATESARNPSVSAISDQRERGRVLNEAWARFQAANLPAMLSALLGWRLGGVRDDSELRAPALARAKDVLLGGAAFNALASAILGATTAAVSWGGATPVRSGTEPSPRTPPGARRAALALHRQRIARAACRHGGHFGAHRGV